MAKKFNDQWKTQTEIGKPFGLSATAVGKILSDAGLKIRNQTNQKAIEEGYARYTPLKDGTSHYLWNASKVVDMISKKHKPLTYIEFHVNEVLARKKEIKRLYDSDSLRDQPLQKIELGSESGGVPKAIRAEVKRIVEEKEKEDKEG